MKFNAVYNKEHRRMLMVSSQCSGSSTVSLVRIKIIIVRITDRPPQWFEFVVGSWLCLLLALSSFSPLLKTQPSQTLGMVKKKTLCGYAVAPCVTEQLKPQAMDPEVQSSSLASSDLSLDKELYSTSSLLTQVYKWVPATYCWRITLP